MAVAPPYPLYDRMYTLHRVSPLHHGDTPLLDPRSLRTHAKRLKEQLKGDNVRGVEVDFAGTEGAMPDKGTLDDCHWEMIGDETAWIDLHVQPDEPVSPKQTRGIEISLEYDKQSYNALLLRDPGSTTSPEGSTSFPLLLTKMPAPIREILLNYLRSTFDARVARLTLPSVFLISSLETYFHHLSAAASNQSITDVIQKLQLQLTFPQNNTSLKNLDISIAASDVASFVSRGKFFLKGQQAPFTSSVAGYLKEHLALDLFHPKVQVSRITCHSFQISADRLRLKAPDISGDNSFSEDDAPAVSASQLAMDDFYTSLIREATGNGKFLPESVVNLSQASTPASAKSTKGARKRAVSNTVMPSAAPKRTKARQAEWKTGKQR